MENPYARIINNNNIIRIDSSEDLSKRIIHTLKC